MPTPPPKASSVLALARSSRYRTTPIYENLGPAMGRWSLSKLQIPESSEDSYHTVGLEDQYRLDRIAYKYYNTPGLWWVLALANDIRNPFVAPSVGLVLRIPSFDRVMASLLLE